MGIADTRSNTHKGHKLGVCLEHLRDIKEKSDRGRGDSKGGKSENRKKGHHRTERSGQIPLLKRAEAF